MDCGGQTVVSLWLFELSYNPWETMFSYCELEQALGCSTCTVARTAWKVISCNPTYSDVTSSCPKKLLIGSWPGYIAPSSSHPPWLAVSMKGTLDFGDVVPVITWWTRCTQVCVGFLWDSSSPTPRPFSLRCYCQTSMVSLLSTWFTPFQVLCEDWTCLGWCLCLLLKRVTT